MPSHIIATMIATRCVLTLATRPNCPTELASTKKDPARGIMNLHLVRPSVADLVFQVYAKPLHPELFDILASRIWQRDDGRVAIHITRSGHKSSPGRIAIAV